ncbi:MAG: hypothetical protein JXA74_11975, partial [Anaerolineae bacterium]|nr:hypothetical protein [Anaerolineae bacterium]
LAQAVRLVATLLALGRSTYVERYTWQTTAVWALPLVALWPSALRRRDRPGVLLLWVALGSATALTYILTLPAFGFGYEAKLAARFFILAQTPFDLLLALALRRLKQVAGWPSLAALAVVCAIQAPALYDYYLNRQASDSYTTLTRTIRAYAEPDDAILLMNDSEWPVFHYYYEGHLPIYHVPYGARGGTELIQPYVAPVLEAHSGVWVVVSPQARQQDPDRQVITHLARSALLRLSQIYDQRQLLLFRRGGDPLCAGEADGYAPQHMVERIFEPGLTLIGYDQALDEARTGQRVSVNTLWHAQAVHGGLRVQVGLVDAAGRLWGRLSRPALLLDLTGECPTKLVRSDLQIMRDVPGGEYRVRVFLERADGAQRWHTDLGRLRLRQIGRVRAQAAQREVSYTLGAGHVALRGYDLWRRNVRSGGQLGVTLYWQALRPMETNYTVFVHLLGQIHNPRTGNPLWGQVDLEPVAGTFPTSAWTPGEHVVDRYELIVDPDAPPGRYELEMGLYDAHTGERLPVYGGEGELLGDHLILTQIEVLPQRGLF